MGMGLPHPRLTQLTERIMKETIEYNKRLHVLDNSSPAYRNLILVGVLSNAF